MAAAPIFVMNLDKLVYDRETETMLSHINVGAGVDCTIKELVEAVAQVAGFSGNVEFDLSKPDGAPRKLMNVDRLTHLGWRHKVTIVEGLAETCRWFVENQSDFCA